jgi:hypothetical protein
LRNCKIHYFAPTTESIEPERKGAVLDKETSWYLTAMYGVVPQINREGMHDDCDDYFDVLEYQRHF